MLIFDSNILNIVKESIFRKFYLKKIIGSVKAD